MRNKILEIGRMLGWDLCAHQREVEGHDRLVWFEAGDLDSLLFQINTAPKTAGCVFFIAEGIISSWHVIDTEAEVELEAERLVPILGKQWFETDENIIKYKKRNPGFCGFTMESLKEPPVFYN